MKTKTYFSHFHAACIVELAFLHYIYTHTHRDTYVHILCVPFVYFIEVFTNENKNLFQGI